MNTIGTVFPVCALLFCLQYVEVFSADNFITYSNTRINTPTNQPIKTRSKVECTSVCLSDFSCCFANYRNSTNDCEIITSKDCYITPVVSIIWQLLQRGRFFNNKVFFYFTKRESWNNAQTECSAGGMRLATVNSSAENNFLKSFVNHQIGTWIGGTDTPNEGDWEWVFPRKPIVFFDWYTTIIRQPDQGTVSNCLVYYSLAPGFYQWCDGPCYRTHYYICERVVHVTEDSWPIE